MRGCEGKNGIGRGSPASDSLFEDLRGERKV